MDTLAIQVRENLEREFGEDILLDFHDEKGDGKHFSLDIVSAKFEGKNRVERSQMVYKLLDGMMQTGKIHALRMKCRTPQEAV